MLTVFHKKAVTILRYIKDKVRLYKTFIIPGIAIVIAWWVLAFGKYGSDITEMQGFLFFCLQNLYKKNLYKKKYE